MARSLAPRGRPSPYNRAMSVLSAADREHLRELFAGLPHDVKLLFFSRSVGCELCPDTKRILQELVAASPRVSFEELNLVLDKERAGAYGVTEAPAIVVLRQPADGEPWDPGIRFVGAPLGYEFTSLVDAITLVSTGETGLSAESRSLLAAVTSPLHIQVYVTPT